MTPARGGDRLRVGEQRLLMKAVLDRGVAAALLLLTGLWLLLIAVAIRLDSRGPIFDRDRRLGRYGREFSLLRFRSTVLAIPPDAGPDRERAGVVRVRVTTRVGRILQRYCLDELPKLINVVRGDMSLVGPRPQDPRAAEGEGGVLPVKPGLTGLYRGGLRARSRHGEPDADRPMDVEDYVRNYSVGLDLAILGHALRHGISSGDVH